MRRAERGLSKAEVFVEMYINQKSLSIWNLYSRFCPFIQLRSSIESNDTRILNWLFLWSTKNFFFNDSKMVDAQKCSDFFFMLLAIDGERRIFWGGSKEWRVNSEIHWLVAKKKICGEPKKCFCKLTEKAVGRYGMHKVGVPLSSPSLYPNPHYYYPILILRITVGWGGWGGHLG